MITIGSVVRLPPGRANAGGVGVVVEILETHTADVVGPYGSLRVTWSEWADVEALAPVSLDEQESALLAMAVADRNSAVRLCHDYAATAAAAQTRCVALEQALTGATTLLRSISVEMTLRLENVIKNLLDDAEAP